MAASMSEKSKTEKPWGGRFSAPTNEFVENFTASVNFDQRLYEHDIVGSIAHATMLCEAGILGEPECALIVDGLNGIRSDIEAGQFHWSVALEDVHMNIERALVERIGDTGKQLHTARSRNDQVATDIRLFLREQVDAIVAGLDSLMTSLVDLAEREAATIMPGYTHLQTAQPISFGHHMLAWFEIWCAIGSAF
jgi:argininosuccinate lyase